MATFKECVSGVWGLTTDILAASKPIAQGVRYTTTAMAEASVQLLVAVAATEEEHRAADEITARYFKD